MVEESIAQMSGRPHALPSGYYLYPIMCPMSDKGTSGMMRPPHLSGPDLRIRLRRLGLTQAQAAELLGLSLDGLHKQLSGARRVTRRTEIILELIEELRRPRCQ